MTDYNPEVMYLLPYLPIINKWNKIDISIFPHCKSTSTKLVLFNTQLGSTLGLPRFTKYIRDITYLNNECLSIFVGLLLGDANFNYNKSNKKVRISFKQSMINLPFMFEVFSKVSHYCSSLPRYEEVHLKINNKKYGRLVLETRSYSIFNRLENLFIENKIKIIKPDLFHYLTPTALAYWIMCDGVSNQYGVTLCTDGFRNSDVGRLINMLIIKYNLDCRMHFYNGKPRIYISAKSMKNLRLLIKYDIIPFSFYKLKKGRRFLS